jgi:hypothetical protein
MKKTLRNYDNNTQQRRYLILMNKYKQRKEVLSYKRKRIPMHLSIYPQIQQKMISKPIKKIEK